ncbi:tripartite motif-containing protein 43-like [Meriones unguiculatus]|uniref:tripartite motif-containing protein 43-like n=1 Tax=Meriones unguiculatus TaxID=10047 RepID=UPI00293F5D90|nr:tripartite motif-containing protein 43-like [Meriones unguiculatus]XP_060242113.1 tripartite motif-containing protein 43-like [Meriones unguiculatus]
MESDISQAFQEVLTCPICLGCLTDPVTTSCGHSFCRACLCFSWEDLQVPVHCPMCKNPSQKKDFRTNVVLKKLVHIARQDSLMKYLSSEENKCVIHKEAKRIFCEENRVLLCQLCSDSQEHKGHRHCPVEAASEGQMEKLLKQMASLWEKIQENQENLEAKKRMPTQWSDYVTLRKEMIRTEYRKGRPVLHEEEQQHIECMENEGQALLEKLRKSKALMVHKRNQLREMYRELMTTSQQPYVVLLQDLEDMFRRSESVQLFMPQVMKPELSVLPITGLIERCKCFLVNIFFGNAILLHDKMNLFDVLKRFSFSPHHQETSVESAGHYFASCGSQSFFSRKYYWEMDLTDYPEWAIGVCEDDYLTNTRQQTEPEGAFLLVCVKKGNQYSLLTTCPVIHHYIEKPVGRVGVFLDCEGGCVSFLDVAKSSLIYSYPPGTFNYPVRPFFSLGGILIESITQYFIVV